MTSQWPPIGGSEQNAGAAGPWAERPSQPGTQQAPPQPQPQPQPPYGRPQYGQPQPAQPRPGQPPYGQPQQTQPGPAQPQPQYAAPRGAQGPSPQLRPQAPAQYGRPQARGPGAALVGSTGAAAAPRQGGFAASGAYGAVAAPANEVGHLHQQFLAATPRRSNLAMIIVTVIVGLLALGVVAFFVIAYASQGNQAQDIVLWSLALAMLPISFVWLVVWFIDRWEPEPVGYLFAAIFWGGGVAVLGALLLGSLSQLLYAALGVDEVTTTVLGAVLDAPLHEEMMKGAGLLVVYFAARRHFNGPVDGLVYGALMGAGFAFTENLLYFTGVGLQSYEQAGVGGAITGIGTQFFFRGIALPLLHPICVSFTGATVGWAARRYGPGRVIAFWFIGLIPGMLLHAAWNGISTMAGFASTGGEALSTMAIGFFGIMFPTFIGWIILVVMLRRGQARQLRERLQEYAAAGWYSRGEVEMLSTMRGRSSARGWARRMSPEMGRAMRSFISESSHLAVVRSRLLHEGASASRQKDEAETLQVLTSVRRRLNAAQSAYAVPR